MASGSNVSYTRFGTPQWSHSGAFNLGAATAYYLLPAGGFGVVALTNGAPVGAPEAFCLTLVDIVQGIERHSGLDRDRRHRLCRHGRYRRMEQIATGPRRPRMRPARCPTRPTWEPTRMTYYGDVNIAAGGDGLVLRIGPKPLEFPLTHFDRDTFTWQPIGENAYGLSGLTFTIEGNNPGQRLQRSVSGQRRRR